MNPARQFDYISKDKKGLTVKGRELANSEGELITKLMRRDLTIISIKEVGSSRALSFMAKGGKGLSTFDLMVLCKQLSTMIKGGVPLVRAIETIAEESSNKRLQGPLIEIAHSIREGDALSASLKKMPHLFSPLFIAIVEAGEKVGAMDIMLERLSKYLLARDRINKKIIAALTYPAIIVAFFIFSMLGVTLFLIPKFKDLYAGLGSKLPPITLFVFGISGFIIHNILIILIVTATIGFYLYRQIFKTKKGRYIFDKLSLKIPIFGEVIKLAAIAKFTRTLSTLLEQSISVPESLELVGRTAGNSVIEEASLKAAKLILDGEKIPEAFRKAGVFPSLMLQMSTVGVESGNLPDLLDKTADFYEDRVDAFVAAMSSLIEPILIAVLGVLLGVVIIALYMPIFTLGDAMYQGAR